METATMTESPGTPAIQTHDLTRYFGDKPAVQSMNLTVPRGKITAFLGRNGSGKSTTIRMLLGLLPPTRGSAKILDYDSCNLPTEARGRIGYMAETHPVFGWMSIADHGRYQAACYPRWNQSIFDSVVRHFRLRSGDRARSISRGQQAGLCLAMVLATEPELLILDDPAFGLDPVAGRSLVEAMLFVTGKQDRTILFSSHQLSDVERVADHIAILDQSILRVCCPVETFRNKVRQLVLRFSGDAPAIPAMPAVPGLLRCVRFENELRLTIVDSSPNTDDWLRSLNAAQIETVPISLENGFLDYLNDRGSSGSLLSEIGGAA
jgi:ABC-2 type transport system ATP-binding protein